MGLSELIRKLLPASGNMVDKNQIYGPGHQNNELKKKKDAKMLCRAEGNCRVGDNSLFE